MKPNACVDLDGTLLHCDGGTYSSDNFGDAFAGADVFLKKLMEHFYVIIYTCRVQMEHRPKEMPPGEWQMFICSRIAEAMSERDLPFNEIWIGEGKPIAAVYIDDRGISCAPGDHPGVFPFEIYSDTLRSIEELPKVSFAGSS